MSTDNGVEGGGAAHTIGSITFAPPDTLSVRATGPSLSAFEQLGLQCTVKRLAAALQESNQWLFGNGQPEKQAEVRERNKSLLRELGFEVAL